MKAKIRATGEIVDVKMTKWGLYGDTTNMNRLYPLHDIEIIEDTTKNVNNIDWEQRRYEIAKEAMLRMINPNVLTQRYCVMAVNAVEFANALIEELKEARRPNEEQ